MKQSKLVSMLLITLMVCGWALALLKDDSAENEEYLRHVEMAEEYVQRGLYQKSIEEYDSALAIRNTEDVWKCKLDSYERCYEENKKIYNDYLNAAQTAVSYYSSNVEYLITLANLYITRNEYLAAYKALEKAINNGMDDVSVNELLFDVTYAYEIKWKSYTDYRTCVNGYYAVCETGVWTYTGEDNSDTEFEKLFFAGDVGEDGIRVIESESKACLINENEVVQGFLNFKPEDAGYYSEGLVPICNNGIYGYYDSLGDLQFGNYTYAGAFINGQAAVKKDNIWFLIDKEGNKVSEDTYEDIVLNNGGIYISDGVMIAKKDGYYKFYNGEEQYGSYDNVDVLTDDKIIAVCKDNKWGFVDIEGNELIAPVYAGAKSFSNGLAAVSNGEYWGFINTDGELVIDYIFYGADYFNSSGCCMVETGKGTNWQLISLYINQ